MRARRQAALRTALQGLIGGLQENGFSPADASRFARLILSRPGIVIGARGRVNYRGKRYEAAEFADTPLADFITGKTAEKQNEAAIEADAGYQQTLAELEMQRETGLTEAAEQRRRALLDFGDPSFVGDDALLAGQAGANPFSTVRLLEQQFLREQANIRQQAARYGTLFGGGYQSGLAEAGRLNAARNTEATRDLQDLLAGLASQSASLRSGYDLGKARALQEATQRLLASGVIHAAKPPAVKFGGFDFWRGAFPSQHPGWKKNPIVYGKKGPLAY